MKIQISRNSKQSDKRYSSVYHQQGRMLTDSDLTEQALISRDRLSSALKDVIGSGTPRLNGIMSADGDKNVELFWGRAYVDGVPAELVAADTAPDDVVFSYPDQFDYPGAPALPEEAYRLYLDVWERAVNWLEDDLLRDPGLHGADTTARTQTMAQVKWCDKEIDSLCPDENPAIGDARVHLVLRSLSTSEDLCDPCSNELDLNEAVGNYLFRVEIHDVHYDENNNADEVVVKWSSENGAEAYKTADVPPDFSNEQFIYEFFDLTTEKHLGNHLARDNANLRIIDGNRSELQNEFSESSPATKDFVRRWDGWCRLQKNGPGWQLVEGFEGTIDLSRGIGSGKPGNVQSDGDTVTIELRVITFSIYVNDSFVIAGDYWQAPVRESIHQQGDILLEDESTGDGALPNGELHHYLLLADVTDTGDMMLPSGSDCDEYDACKIPQFPSLTDLRADDICYENSTCKMPEVSTVQDALDHLCRERDLAWHNKHLHGWGIVCGLELECDEKNRNNVLLQPGYALDCEGEDLVIDRQFPINILKLLAEAKIDIQDVQRANGNGVCLYLDRDNDENISIGIEQYNDDDSGFSDAFIDTLLYDFFYECIYSLFDAFSNFSDKDIKSRCAISDCGKELMSPSKRRILALINLIFDSSDTDEKTVLNVSFCEHMLLKDLYDQFKKIITSKTFCAQFDDNTFPDYPFKKECRGTWATPERFDHIRINPSANVVAGWQRDSARIYLFKQIKQKLPCTGDLVGYIDIDTVQGGTITDVIFTENNTVYVSAIIHEADTVILTGELNLNAAKECQIDIDWSETYICDVKITKIEVSPWNSSQIYGVALCKGVYVLETENLKKINKIERPPAWQFPASGDLEFDISTNLVIATAFDATAKAEVKYYATTAAACNEGYYNSLAIFKGDKPGDNTQVAIHRMIVSEGYVIGRDGIVVTSDLDVSINADLNKKAAVSNDVYVFVVTDKVDNKSLSVFNLADVGGSGEARMITGTHVHSFGDAEKVSLQYVSTDKTDGILASRLAMHDIQFIPTDFSQRRKRKVYSIPVQIAPVEIVADDDDQQLYALNYLGQSITVLDYSFVNYDKQRASLRVYREAILNAFQGLLYDVIQYIKDCFCHHLLVKCPECDDDDKVYLGCVSIEGNDVYNICNFSKRKYVKTWPTISYWMSIIPIEALAGWLVEKLCCYVFPFGDQKSLGLKNAPYMAVASAALNADQSRILSRMSSRGGKLFESNVTSLIGAGFDSKTAFNDGMDLKYAYKPGVFVQEKAFIESNEDLIKRVEEINQDRITNTNELQRFTSDIETMKTQRQALQMNVETIMTEKQMADQKIVELEQTVSSLQLESAQANARVVELESSITEVLKLKQDMVVIVEGGKSISTLTEVSTNDSQILSENQIKTVAELAAQDQQSLEKIGFSKENAENLLLAVNNRLGK